jgi:hypothetical protein
MRCLVHEVRFGLGIVDYLGSNAQDEKKYCGEAEEDCNYGSHGVTSCEPVKWQVTMPKDYAGTPERSVTGLTKEHPEASVPGKSLPESTSTLKRPQDVTKTKQPTPFQDHPDAIGLHRRAYRYPAWCEAPENIFLEGEAT